MLRMARITELVRDAYDTGVEEGVQAMSIKSINYIRGFFKSELEIACNDVRVTFDTKNMISKDWFYPKCINGQPYEPSMTAYFLQELGEDSVCYDIGANVGYYTLFASEVCTDGEVHSFELDEKFIEAITANLEKNNTSATINQNAVSSETGDTINYSDKIVPRVSVDQSETNSVETITLDEYIQTHSVPNVVKIDVEGFEYHVLKGAEQLLEQPELETMFIELHPKYLRQYGHSKHDVLSLLNRAGFEYSVLANHRDSGDSVLQDATPDEITDNTMLVCHR